MGERDFGLVKDLKDNKLKDKAFARLLDMYQENLYWHIRKIVITHDNANDVLQNTFIRVYRNIHSFEGKSSLKTWMFRIAYNESIRYIEKNKSLTNATSDIDDTYLGNLKQDVQFDGNEIQLKLHAILSKLTEKQRIIFNMKYFDDLSFRQIAEILDISENTLKSSYYSAVKIIEEKILS